MKDLVPEWMLRLENYYVVTTDLEGRYTFVNRCFDHRFDYMGGDLMGKPFGVTIHPEDVEVANQAAYRCIQHPGETVSIEIRKPTQRSGEFYWTHWEFSLLNDREGKPAGIVCLGHDISDTKKVRKQNDELLSFFKDIGNNLPGMIYQFRAQPDGSFCFPFITGGIRKYFGLNPEDVQESAKPAFDLIHPADRAKVHETIAMSAKTGKEWQCAFRVLLEDKTLWIEGKSTVAQTEDGSRVWNGFFNDITKQQEYLHQLKENEERLQGLLDLQTCYVIRLDMQGNYTYANQKYLDVFGFLYRKDTMDVEYLGKNSEGAIFPEDLPKVAAAIEQLQKEPAKVVQADIRKPLENGQVAYTLWDFSFIFDSSGQPVEIQCVGIDYTERRKKEKELRESEYKLNAVLNSTQDGNVLVDMDYKILSFNKAAQKDTQMVFGRSLREKDSILEFVLPETKEIFLQDSQEALNGNFTRREFKVKRYWFEFSFFPVYDSDDQQIGFSMNVRNIDNRKKQEKSLYKAKKEAEEANKAKSDFLANMSHELRTPLNGVIGFTEILSGTNLTPVQEQYVKNANVSGQNLLKIINDILSLSKIEAGMLELDFVKVDLIELIDSCINVVKPSAEKKQLLLKKTIDQELPRFVITDPLRLSQILSNLLSNAIKFTDRGEVELSVHYRPLGGKEGRILFSVRDTGVGITEKNKKKLFKAFSQADSSTTRRYGGTGLGLAISQMIADKFDSRIEFESTLGEGSRFYFEITLKTESESGKEDSLSKQKPPETENVTRSNSRILIAEDVALNMKLIIALLRSINPMAELLKAEDGAEAVELYKKKEPDLILMDVQMPKMDGLEATKKIRSFERNKSKHTKIIALTAAAMDEDRQNCLEAGMDGVITKPISVNKLKDVVGTL